MKRMLSILLALCMAAGLLCTAATPAYAQDVDVAPYEVENGSGDTDIWSIIAQILAEVLGVGGLLTIFVGIPSLIIGGLVLGVLAIVGVGGVAVVGGGGILAAVLGVVLYFVFRDDGSGN